MFNGYKSSVDCHDTTVCLSVSLEADND